MAASLSTSSPGNLGTAEIMRDLLHLTYRTYLPESSPNYCVSVYLSKLELTKYAEPIMSRIGLVEI